MLHAEALGYVKKSQCVRSERPSEVVTSHITPWLKRKWHLAPWPTNGSAASPARSMKHMHESAVPECLGMELLAPLRQSGGSSNKPLTSYSTCSWQLLVSPVLSELARRVQKLMLMIMGSTNHSKKHGGYRFLSRMSFAICSFWKTQSCFHLASNMHLLCGAREESKNHRSLVKSGPIGAINLSQLSKYIGQLQGKLCKPSGNSRHTYSGILCG